MNFATSTAIMLMKPFITDIIKDIVTSQYFHSAAADIRDNTFEAIMGITRKTHFSWDDELAQGLIDHMLAGAEIDGMTDKLLTAAEDWVKDSETEWDDLVVLPVLDEFRNAIVANGGAVQ